ncbi:hypothetical protein [Frankia sp. CcI49]|uniref:hypothetical protein n=1 Tax=Frankia sp. CcI49 TaxID=1745382 RepID=UPI001054ED6D|nr:hypothetical protein [Frankia sp. CcI49]
MTPHRATEHPGWNPSVLRRYRLQYGLTLPTLAERIRNIDADSARERSFTPPLATAEVIGKHERGQTYPGADYRASYRHIFGTGDADLGFRHRLPAEQAQTTPQQADSPSDRAASSPPPYSGDIGGYTASRPPDTDGPERRIMTESEEAFNFLVNAERAAARPEVLDFLTQQVRSLAIAFPTEATNLVGPLLDAQRVAFRLLDGPTPPDQARDLYFLAAITSGLLARAGVDLSQHTTADIYARVAYLCADRADHPGLRIWVRTEQARAAYWTGAPHEALRYIEAAEADVHLVHGTAAIETAVQAARAHAALGDSAQAHAAIRRAVDLRERTRPDDLDEIGGELSTPVAVQLFIASDALTRLPEDPRAEQAAMDAVEAFAAAGNASYGSRAGAHINLALARTRRGDVDGAQDALRPVLAIPAQRRNHGIRTLMQRIQGALTDQRYGRSPQALDIAAEVENYCQVTPTTRIPE